MIRNIVFDVGNVLFAYNPQKIMSELLPGTPHAEFYLQNLFYSDFWEDLDHGKYDPEETKTHLHRIANGHTQKADEMLHLLEYFVDHLELIEGTKTLFSELSDKNYPLYILSNFQDRPFDRLVSRHPFMAKAHGMIVSAKVKHLKP